MKNNIEIMSQEEQATEAIKESFADQYRKLLKNKIEKGYYDNDSEIEEEINLKVEGELSFMNTILETSKIAKDENPEKEIILLCDMDETLVKTIFDAGGKNEDFLRPSLPILFKSLKEMDIKIGLLTNRKIIKQQVENNEKLSLLKEYCDPDNIYSTRDTLDLERDEELKKDSRIIEDINLSSNGNLEKIAFFDDLLKNNPEKIFIVVDDFKYPILYKYGVALESDQGFSFN